MDWMSIVSALALVMLALVWFPIARRKLKDSPEGTSADWLSALIPIAFVGVFIVFLVAIL